MNIGIITSSFPSRPDDTVRAPFLIEFIGELRKRKHQVFVFTQDREGEKEEFLDGVRIKWFPWVKSKKPLVQLSPFRPMDFLRILSLFYQGRITLPSFIRENKIEACLALWVFPSGYFANRAFRQARIPYSVWSLGSDIYRYGKNPFLYPTMRRIIHEARGVFADGFDLSKRVEDRFGRKCFFLATTRTIPFSSPVSVGIRKWTGDPYHFLFVGRIERVKGIDLLLESLACLKEEASNVRLTVVGSGSMEEWARRFIREKRLEEYVSWMGKVSDQALASLYDASHCVVIPSRSESIPVVFSEALKFNKELIVTDVGDMGMLGRQYGVARVIPPENVGALKQAMKESADLKDHENEKRNEARKEELKHLFDIGTSAGRFLADFQ
ncbi:MAG TPA: glycosyltransferase [Thermodesulfobacteriota bacterium]|nr:glycosyltransferase [Thermodesulfobacteriota bacterium]